MIQHQSFKDRDRQELQEAVSVDQAFGSRGREGPISSLVIIERPDVR
jgi:hypothetical protein